MSNVIKYSLCVYWGIRPESRETVADKLTTYLHRLALLDDAFLSWFPPIKRKPKKNPQKIPINKDAIALMLTTQKTEMDHQPMPELGFGFSAWSGLNPKFNVGISADCGLYTKWLVNSVIISFRGPEFPSMELMKDIYSLMREIFQPEEGAVRIYEKIITEDGEEKYEGRVLESFGKIDENGKATIHQP